MNLSAAIPARIKSLLAGSSATKQALTVSSGAIAAQCVALVAGPINSRLYTPSDYGTLALFSALLSICSVLATMRYDLALPVAEDDTEAIHILLACFSICCAMTALSCLAILLLKNSALPWLARTNPQFLKYVWLLPVGLFANAFFTMLSAWTVRKRNFKDLTIARLNQSILGSGCMIVMGLLRTGGLGLLTGSLVFTSSGVRKLFFTTLKDFRRLKSVISSMDLRRVIIRYYRFPLFVTWATFISSFSAQVPVLFLTKNFGPASAGHFTLCSRILTLPSVVISSAVAPVFFSRIKQAHQEGNLREKTVQMLDSLVGINVFFMIFVALFGEALFTTVFGARWARSGQYAAALAPWVMCNFLAAPLENLPLLFERQGTHLAFQIGFLAVRIGAMLLGIWLQNDLLAMVLFGTASTVYVLIYMGWLLSLVQISLGRPLLKMFRELLIAMALLGSCRLVLWLSHGNLWLTAILLLPCLGFGTYRGLRRLLSGRLAAMEGA